MSSIFTHSKNVNAPGCTFYNVAGNLIQNNCAQADQDLRWVIASWLSDLNFEKTQIDSFAKRTNGTGQWFLESQAFKDWLAEKSGILWCPGIREAINVT